MFKIVFVCSRFSEYVSNEKMENEAFKKKYEQKVNETIANISTISDEIEEKLWKEYVEDFKKNILSEMEKWF